MGWEGWEQPPSRAVVLVDDAWLGAHGAPDRAGRSGAAVAVARSSALRMTARGTTVNVVSLPAGFPDGRSAIGAPLQGQVGVADLSHVLRFLLQPDNGYITGQVIALTGGDLVWSSLSM